MSFRDRFLTRQTAEAITSPSSIVAGGAAAAGAVLLSPAAVVVPVAIAAGAIAYGAVVVLRMPRHRPAPGHDIDLRRLRDPWRWYVKEAQDSRERFSRAVQGADRGPLRDRLADIGGRLDDGVAECWRIARRGQELEDALGQLTPVPVLQQRIRALDDAPPSPTNERLRESLRSQLETHGRIARTAAQARDRVQILEVRLDEAVARAVELSLQARHPGELGGLEDDVDAVVGEMEALRRGLDETASQTATG